VPRGHCILWRLTTSACLALIAVNVRALMFTAIINCSQHVRFLWLLGQERSEQHQ